MQDKIILQAIYQQTENILVSLTYLGSRLSAQQFLTAWIAQRNFINENEETIF